MIHLNIFLMRKLWIVVTSLLILVTALILHCYLDSRPFKVQFIDFLGRDHLGFPSDPWQWKISRKIFAIGASVLSNSTRGDIRTKVFHIPTRSKHYLPSKFFLPYPKKAKEVPLLPVILYFHGGGWVQGGNGSVDGICADISKHAQAVVAAVEYRLAPETKFPGPVEDAYDALIWIHSNVQKFHGDPFRIIVSGDSAGGNLAVAICMMARQEDFVPLIAAQILIYPVLDYDPPSDSSRIYSDGYLLTQEKMRWFWEQYLRSKEDRKNLYAVPLVASDYLLLPPAFILVAEWDILRDEGIKYGKSLRYAGIQTTIVQYNNTIHGFLSMNRLYAEEYDRAIFEIAEYVSNTLPVKPKPSAWMRGSNVHSKNEKSS